MHQCIDNTQLATGFIDDRSTEITELSTTESAAVGGGLIPALVGFGAAAYSHFAATTWVGAFVGRAGLIGASYGLALVFGGENNLKGSSSPRD